MAALFRFWSIVNSMRSAEQHPLIGITTSRRNAKNGYPELYSPEAYCKAVHQNGGIPLLIPLGLPTETYQELVMRLDGILFSGGGDILPEQYNGTSSYNLIHPDPDRDRVEFMLLKAAMSRQLPLLGICRGIQVINVALGGTLYTHLPEELGESVRHQLPSGEPRDTLLHPVRVERGTILHQITSQATLEVNSIHHQGIKDLAHGLRISATAPDGLIEGIEIPEYPFALAVQWHPEHLTHNASMQGIFQAFINAAGEGKKQ